MEISRIKTDGKPEDAGSGQFYGYKNDSTGPGPTAFKDLLHAVKDEDRTLFLVTAGQQRKQSDDFAQMMFDHSVVYGNLLKYGNSYNGYFRGDTAEAVLDSQEFMNKRSGVRYGILMFRSYPDGKICFRDLPEDAPYDTLAQWKVETCDEYDA